MSTTFRIDVLPRDPQPDPHLATEAASIGLGHLTDLRASRYYLVNGDLDQPSANRLGTLLLADPVLEVATLTRPPAEGRRVVEVQRLPGVMDPQEASIIKGAADLGLRLMAVRVGLRVAVAGADEAEMRTLAVKVLANPAVDAIAIDPETAIRFVQPGGSHRHPRCEVPLAGLDDQALLALSRTGCLSLDLAEMRAVQAHFSHLGRAPTDVELESIAQTWSEHCFHKTFKAIVDYQGPEGLRRYDNLLKETIAKATFAINAPWCISVFKDNSGIIEFDADHGLCVKVETHNHPSAIEPYGGANTGLGGVIRDILGTGLGARPIFNTDVFCFGPLTAGPTELPPGTIHPRRLMRQVVAGVRDYGNRMGIPTVNGAVRFDSRFVGNPLVFCGTAGLIPRSGCFGEAQSGDRILLIGGRTGRDGIHGATFSSVELTEASEVVSSGAVQIGNAIEEKKVADTLLAARDAGCFHALTDCGAGGISSAIGEMGAKLGVRVALDLVPVKYEGLSYCEIWISEAQERMVAAVPPDRLTETLAIFAAEDVTATDLGEFTGDGRLVLTDQGVVVADLAMDFLHEGIPRRHLAATYQPIAEQPLRFQPPADLAQTLAEVLARPNVASKEWVIRQYDHEVQAGSIVKPLVGPGRDGPSDAAVVAPLVGRDRGVAVACGINNSYSDFDTYQAAAAGIEEALRNLVCVGAPLDRVALLDNFSWGRCDKPAQLGALVRACQACHDLAIYYQAPFISGKDSLNNEFSHGGKTIVIPATLLITAVAVMDDVTKAVTMDAKAPGDAVVVVGLTRNELGGSEYASLMGDCGGRVPRLDTALSRPVLQAASACIRSGLVSAAHDCSEGGLGTALAEMAFAGGLGLSIDADRIPREPEVDRLDQLLFSESFSRLVLLVPPRHLSEVRKHLRAVPHEVLGNVIDEPLLRISGLGGRLEAELGRLKTAWREGLAVVDG